MIPRLRGRGAAVAALIGYGLLTLVMTYPLIRRFTSAIPGDGFDGWQNYWNLWWVRQALLVEHAHPWFTDMLYAPVGVSLLFHTLNLFNGLTTLPIQLAWGLFPAYNSAVLFSFAMSGLGAYLLARYVLGPRSSRLAAFAAGIIFTFSPFHIAHLLGHMQVMSMEWVPFFALYLLRAVGSESANQQISKSANQQISKRANRRITHHVSRFTFHVSRITHHVRHNLLLAILFLVLVALCDWYYVLYCLIFTAVVFVWIGVRAWRARRAAKPRDEGRQSAPTAARHLVRIALAMAVIWLVWSALLSPVLAPMIREARDYSFMVPNAEDSRRYSADLLAFVVPQQFHPLWGRLVAARSQSLFRATVSEYQVFAGFTVLALALIGMWSAWRGAAASPRVSGAPRAPFQRLWPWVALVFFVLALGPVLHIAGQTALLPGGREIPLPYAALVRVVPFMNISRSVSRYDAMVMLALAILAALGLNWLIARFRRGRWIAVAATALIVFEFLPIPYPLSTSDAPAWYATLAQDSATRQRAQSADELGPAQLPPPPNRPRQAARRRLHQPGRSAHAGRAGAGLPAFPPPEPRHHRARSGQRRGDRCCTTWACVGSCSTAIRCPLRRATSPANTRWRRPRRSSAISRPPTRMIGSSPTRCFRPKRAHRS